MKNSLNFKIILAGTIIGGAIVLTSFNSALAVTTPAATTKTTATTTTAITDATLKADQDAATTALTAYKAAKTADKVAKLIALGDALIAHRSASLNQFVASAFTGLTAAQKATLTAAAQKDLDSLAALKTKIDADTDSTTLKADIKSIFDLAIFRREMAHFHLSVALDQAQALYDKLNPLSARIQKTIDADKTAGKDVTAIQAAETDYVAQLTDAKKQLDAANAELAKVVSGAAAASGTTDATVKTALTNARADMKTLRADLVAAQGDLKTIKTQLATLAAASTTATTTTTTTTP